MALRKSKIASEIVLNNYRYLSSKSDLAVPYSSIKVAEITDVDTQDLGVYRYVVSNTQKPSVLPKIEFPKEPEELIPHEMRHLQPAMLPKFIEMREERKPMEWAPIEMNKECESPFPEPVRELRTKTLVLSDKKKAEMKSPSINVNLKSAANFNVVNRNYSTSPFFIVSRSFAKATKSGKDKEEKCKEKPKVCKVGDCPSFPMKNCPPRQAKTDCFRPYIDPKCTKKLAPYPSYSESCAERLPDDPSECMQCPWKRCGGAESIKPPKRHFHTSTRQIFSESDAAKQQSLCMLPLKECDARKEPCKQPPGKCDKVKHEEKKKKCPEQPKKKKCEKAVTAYQLWDAKENILPSESWHDVDSSSTRLNILELKDIPKFPYDKDQADYDKVSKRKCQIEDDPKCHRKKRKIVPDGCPGDKKKCASELPENFIKLDKKCPKNSNTKCPDVDNRIDPRYKPRNPCCEDEKKGSKHKRNRKPKVYVPDAPNY